MFSSAVATATLYAFTLDDMALRARYCYGADCQRFMPRCCFAAKMPRLRALLLPPCADTLDMLILMPLIPCCRDADMILR